MVQEHDFVIREDKNSHFIFIFRYNQELKITFVHFCLPKIILMSLIVLFDSMSYFWL